MAEEAKEEKESKKSGGSGNMVLIIVIVLLVVILIGGGVAAYFLLSGDEEEMANETTGTIETEQQVEKKAKAAKRVADLLNVGPMYPLDQFIVNLLSENGSRFLKVKIDLELENEEMTAEVDKKVSIIRDVIIKLLSSKTYEEISTLKGKEALKDELVENINSFMADGQIRNVFFTEFVVQ